MWLRLTNAEGLRVFSGPAWSFCVYCVFYPGLCFRSGVRYDKPKPSFSSAMPPDAARAFFAAFVAEVISLHGPALVQQGAFGEMMEVASVNDGPVTLVLDSTDRSGKGKNRVEAVGEAEK